MRFVICVVRPTGFVHSMRSMKLCRHYLARPEARRRIAAQGFERVRDRPLAKYLADVLSTSGA